MDDLERLTDLSEKLSRIQLALSRLLRRRLERARRDKLGVTNEPERQELDESIAALLELAGKRLAEIEDLLAKAETPPQPSK